MQTTKLEANGLGFPFTHCGTDSTVKL